MNRAMITPTSVTDAPMMKTHMNPSRLDTDDASDFTPQPGNLESAIHPSPQAHTLYGIGDEDLVSFAAAVSVGGTARMINVGIAA
mgnify:CR=1 FL=1